MLVFHRGRLDILCNEWLKNLNCLQQSTVEYNGNINSAFPSWECSRAVFIGTFSPERKASMFPTSDLASFRTIIEQKYLILTSNCHDITIRSVLTGHEWIIISGYGSDTCHILYRHSRTYPFHHQRGTYQSLEEALHYIENHDIYFAIKKQGTMSCRAINPNRTL